MHFNLLMAAPTFIHNASLAALFTMAAAVCAFAGTPGPDPAPGSALSSPYAPVAGRQAALPLRVSLRPTPAIAYAGVPDALALPVSHADGGPGWFERKGAYPASAGAAGTGADGTDWRWRRAHPAAYVALPLAIAGTLIFERENGDPARPNWRARNDFDESFRDVLRLKSRSARDKAHLAGDVVMGVMIAAPVVDSFATLGFRDANWDALIQTSVVNVESFAFTSLVSSLMQNFIAREKPFVRNCVNGSCDDDQPNRSMPSGHVAFAFTGAGLLCTHHKYQSLHGDPAAEKAACATGLGLAAVDGIVRIMADRHYATDVLAGTAIGLFSGFVLPRLLHYAWPQTPPDAGTKGSSGNSLVKGMRVNPRLLSGGGALNWDFRF